MWNWIAELERQRINGQPLTLVTVTSCTGSTPRDVGAKMIVFPDGPFLGTIGGGHLEELALQDARRCLKEERSQTLRYPLGAKTGQCCGGVMELLMEVIGVGPKLYLFGAGHVGQAVARTLQGTPFEVHAIDARPEWIDSSALGPDVVRHAESWEDFLPRLPWSADKTYLVVMTHRHDDDQAIIQEAIRHPAAYIGLIGSHAKWERFQQRLSARGVSAQALARVKSPIGLVHGGKAPQEIAISLAAELLGAYYAHRPTEVAAAVDSAGGRDVSAQPG